MKPIILFILVFYCTLLSAQVKEYEQGQVFLKVRDNYSKSLELSRLRNNSSRLPDAIEVLISKYGITSIEKPFRLHDEKLQRIYLVQFTDTNSADGLVNELASIDFIDYAEKVPLYKVDYTPNDYNSTLQWSLKQINAPQAWDAQRNASNVVIAIVDDAVRTTHRDLAASIWTNPGEIPNNGIDDDHNGYIDDVHGYDVANNDNNPNPPATASSSYFSHGTHCAGIAAGRSDDNAGIASISFNAKIMPVKTKVDGTIGGALQAPYLGIEYAIAAHADVISMSWGGYSTSQTYQTLLDIAHYYGIILVAAAGNDNTLVPFFPADFGHVISVGATANDIPRGGIFADNKAAFSNYNIGVDVMAPGTNIYSCWATNDTSYGMYSGTSMSCPLVAGLAALMLGKDTSQTPDEIEHCLKATCVNISADNINYPGFLGAGRIDAQAALSCIKLVYAKFSSDITFACAGNTVHFTDRSTHHPTSWQWSFPGGTSGFSNQQNPTVTYTTNGSYNVTLIATSPTGTDTLVMTNYITVGVPSITLNGTDTVYPGFTSYIPINFIGNPPFTLTLTDGTTSYPVTTSDNPYYFSIAPLADMTFSIANYTSNGCTGTSTGSHILVINPNPAPCNTVMHIAEISQATYPSFFSFVRNLVSPSIDNLGDLNGDGVNDLVVGRPYDSITHTFQGTVTIMFLDSASNIIAKQDIGEGLGNYVGSINEGANFGYNVKNIGDLDGDGIIDIAVGRPVNFGFPGTFTGAVEILFLNRNGTVKSQTKIDDREPLLTQALDASYGFGSSLVSIGDLDGDSINDLIVGDKNRVYSTLPGHLYALFMRRNGTIKGMRQITYGANGLQDGTDGNNFGFALGNLGDLNGDGINELGVGESYTDSTQSPTRYSMGKLWVMFMNRNGTINHFKILRSPSSIVQQSGDYFGSSSCTLGDADGDGRPNVLVGAPATNNWTGCFWMLNLNTDGSIYDTVSYPYTTPPYPLNHIARIFTSFGMSVTGIGDINHDGITDVAASAFNFSTIDSTDDFGFAGAIFILNLSPCPSPICSITANFKASKACAGNATLFNDLSTDNSSHIVSWKWKFGDGDSLSGSGNPQHSYLTAGTYTVTLTVANDASPPCLQTVTKTVTVSSAFSVFTNDTLHVCLGDSIALGLTDTACGTAPFTYSWLPTNGLNNPTAATPIFTDRTNTTYTLTVTDSLHHTASTHVFVKVDSNCCHTKALVNVPNSAYCIGSNIALQNLSIASPQATYAWSYQGHTSSNHTPPTLNFNAPGSYPVTLTITDTCGISDTTVYINILPSPMHGARIDTSTCGGNIFQVPWPAVIDYSYSWQPTIGVSDTNAADPILTSLTPTLYIRTTTSDNSGCQVRDTVNITSAGQAIYVNLGNDTTICFPNAVTLDATTTGATYLWQNGSIGNTLVVHNTGWYSVTVSNSCGTGSDSIYITVNQSVQLNLGNDTVVCFPNTLTLNATVTDGTYLWQNGSTASTYNIDNTGVYWVNVSNGCNTATDSISVIMDKDIRFNLGNDTTICQGDSLVILNPSNFQDYYWQGVLNNNTYYTISSSNTYVLLVYDSFHCTATDTIAVTTQVCDGIGEINDGNNIQVYPNPSEGLYRIAITGLHASDRITLATYDLLGQNIYSTVQTTTNNTFTADLEIRNNPAGVYLLQIKINGMSYYRNLILSK